MTERSSPETGSDVERHPGPFSGPDAELARACAMAVIPWYGNDDAVTYQRIIKGGIWNDHVAVQAALAAIHNVRKAAGLAQCQQQPLVHIDNVVYHLDDIEVDADGKCAWTDVANAMTHIKLCIEPYADTSTDRPRCDGADDLEHLDGMLDDRERG